ncbi:MAG: alpha-L-arabinofuranosidase C-terminal domain-containing protein, partial [Armatimonadota bacterium]
YWVFWLYHHYFGDLLVNCKVECDSYETEGGYGVLPARGKPTLFQLFPTNLIPEQRWTLQNVNGVKHWEGPDGTLVVEILTDEDLNYYHAVKRMPAEPLTGYRVTAEIRTEGLTKSRGAQIQVGDGRGWIATRSASLSEEVKSEVWRTVSVDYITLPDTREIEIRIRRLEGTGSEGKIFVRNLKVQKFTPFNLGSVPLISAVASKSEDGKRVFIAIINKSLDEPIETKILGVKARRAFAWTLTGQGVDETNELNPNAVRPKEINGISVKRGEIVLVLPPHSFTVVVAE